jgi:hypothetical protein
VSDGVGCDLRRLTNFGLLLFWSLLTLFVVYAPRKGADEVNPSREVCVCCAVRAHAQCVLYEIDVTRRAHAD